MTDVTNSADDLRALAVAEEAARIAGAELLRHYERLDPSAIRTKSVRRDLVSAADLASERILLDRIRAEFPDDAIHAEESSRAGSQGAASTGAVWYLDPLDGTTNFVHGLPEFTISIARFVEGAPRVAVVFAPALRELYSARAQGGAHRNGSPIAVRPNAILADALLATGFPYRRAELENNNLGNFTNMFLRCRDIRRLGSAALDLAFVACGRFDGYWELHLERHDVAAGGLLVAEAGGTVTDLRGGASWPTGRSILATNGPLHAELLTLLRE